MLVSLIILAIGISGWVAGAFYERNLPYYNSTKGLAAFPGCFVAIIGLVCFLWSLVWWVGLVTLLVVLCGAYRLIAPDKYQIWK